MRRRLWALSIIGGTGLAAVTIAGCAAKKPAAGEPAAPTSPASTTPALSEVPDLRGVWAFVTHVAVNAKDEPDQFTNQLIVFRIHDRGERMPATHLNLTWTPLVQQSLTTAGQAKVRWQPTEADLAALRGTLLANPPGEIGAEAEFNAVLRSGYGPFEQKDPDSVGSQFLLGIRDKDLNPPIAMNAAHYVTVIEPDHLSGRYSVGIVATAAGTPVVVGFHGAFDMYRLGD